MLHGEVRSPHLRSLLAFEAERHGLPVRFQESRLSGGFTPPPFRREAVIISHAEYHRERFGVRLGDEEVLLNVPAHIADVGEPVGYEDRGGEFVPLGAVINNVLVSFVSLEALAQPDAVLARRPLNGHVPDRPVLAGVFDLVVGQALPKIKARIESYDWTLERRRFADARSREVRTRLEGFRQNILMNDRSIEEKTYELARLARKNQELREQVRFLEAVTESRIRKDAEREYVSLVNLAPEAFDDVRVSDERVVARSYPIDVEWNGETYALGTFQLSLHLDTDEVRIAKVSGAKPDGYPHPHVAGSGVPCFGNIGAPLAKLLAEGQYVAALSVLSQFLRSYNPADAYLRIEQWDPNWRDERWERCYEQTSPQDCVDCEDSECPYFDDRHDWCWESQRNEGAPGLAACIRCRECDHHDDAEQACRASAPLRRCIDCDLPCSYAGNTLDMENCHANRAGSCGDCPTGSCRFQGEAQDGDEADDAGGEEAAA